MNHGAMVAIHAATTAAAAAKARTQVLDAFRTHDATAPDRARTLAEVRVGNDHVFRALVEAGVVRGVDSRGRLTVLGDSVDRVAGYYLDEAAYIAHRDGTDRTSSRKAVAVVVCVLVAVAVAVAVAFVSRSSG